MNGQGVVDVIESCVPDINDAWQIKSYDLDTLLVAIRIATYGETMSIGFTVPVVNEQVEHTINLPAILDEIQKARVQSEITLKDGLKIKVRPLTYRDMTSTSLRTFQEQKMYTAVQDSQLPDEEKAKRFNEAFKKLTDLNSEILLLDESTSNLDFTTRDMIFDILKDKNITIINSTHNHDEFEYDHHIKIEYFDDKRTFKTLI